MAKTELFSAGGAIADIEGITGIEAPVAEDFQAVPFGTVFHEHGERRVIQNQIGNLRSSSGIERVSFDGIDELDTERGPDGEQVFALNTGDSRIRFVGSGWVASTGVGGGDNSTLIRTLTDNDYIEITFFGTTLNLLVFMDNTVLPNYDWRATVDGGTEGGSLRPTNPSAVLQGQNIKMNVILPVASGLTAGVHTVRIRNFNNGAGTDGFTLYGCEIINENAAITQQPGADFNSRIELMAQGTFPIKPDNTTIPSLNSSSGVLAALSGTDGARVLNYITSSGNLKQSFEPVVETLNGAGSNLHTITFSASGAGAVTLPADVTSWSILAFGAGGGGGGAAFAQSSNFLSQLATASAGGGAGAGGGRSFSNFTKTGGTTTAIVTTVGAGTSGTGVVASGFGDMTATATAGGDGGTTSVTVGGTELISATGGGGGGGASAASRINDNVFTQANPGANETTQRGQGTGADGAKGSTNITAVNTINSGDTNAGDDARNGSGTVGAKTEQAGFTPNEAGGTGGAGAQPGGSAGGNGATSNSGLTGQNGGATVGSIVLVFQSASGTALTVTNGTDVVVTSGAVENSPFFNFGTTDHSRQEVIRRINFREFGANNPTDFSTLAGSGSDRAFTLADGTTTLVGNDVFTHPENGETGVTISQTTGFLTLSFVGTGLDITNNRSASLATHNVRVDGFSIGTLSGVQPVGVIPIVSGLAYGTHTVQFALENANLERLSVVDFIIYGPKKPEIPADDAGSKELSEYNVVADYAQTAATGTDATSGLGGLLTLGKGLLRKMGTREVRPDNNFGTSSSGGNRNDINGINTGAINGTTFGVSSANAFEEFTFYGTGFDLRFSGGTGKRFLVVLNPASGTGTQTPIALANSDFYGDAGGTQALTFVIGDTTAPERTANSLADVTNSVMQVSTASGASSNSGFRKLDIDGTGIPKVHTIRVYSLVGAGNNMFFRSWDVITPIHINEDTLKVGSQGLDDLRLDPVVEEDEVQVQNLGEAKAWFNYDTATNAIDSSYNISAIIETSGAQRVIVYFDKPFKDNSYICCPAIEPSANTSAATIQIDRQAAEAGTRDSKTASGCTLLSNSIGTFTCSFFGELIDE